jgi:RNA polymerase sigma-70 factor (ECF subfamily)
MATDGASDGQLWVAAGAGDRAAFRSLWERHAGSVRRFCLLRTGDPAWAEDCASIVFLHAWRRRAERLTNGSVRAWLFGIAENVVRDHKRSLRRERLAVGRIERSTDTPDFADDVAERIDAQQVARIVCASVATLPRRHKEVLTLSCGGLSYRQAAEALGLPINTVRSRLYRARARLRELAGVSGHGVIGTAPAPPIGPRRR